MANKYLEGTAVEFWRWDGKSEGLIPNRIVCSFSAFALLLFVPLSVDHQVEFHHRIYCSDDYLNSLRFNCKVVKS